jgi:hypothetical protein
VHASGWIPGRADIEELRAAPLLFGDRLEIERKAVGRGLVDQDRFAPGENRRPFVDLIERVRTDNGRQGTRAVHDSLRKGKQGLAGAVDRQHLRGRVEPRQTIPPLEPFGQRVAQHIQPRRGWVDGQAVEMRDQ